MTRLVETLKGAITDRPPFWFMRQAGRYLPEYRDVRKKAGSFLDLCYTPELACEVTLQPIRRFHPDAAILFADILLIPQAMGQKLWFEEGSGPRLEPVTDKWAVATLRPEEAVEKLSPVIETVRLLKHELSPDVALIGFAGAPWTVACYMVEGRGSPDFRTAKIWAFRDMAGFGELIDKVTGATIEYLSAQAEAGADALQLFDTWAGLLPDRAFEAWCVKPVARIRAALKERFPDLPVIAFPRGAGPRLLSYGSDTGVDAISLDTAVPVQWAAENLPAGQCLQGNLDPLCLVAGGDAMREACSHILSRLTARPFVFNLGHGIVPETPPQHVEEVSELLKEFSLKEK